MTLENGPIETLKKKKKKQRIDVEVESETLKSKKHLKRHLADDENADSSSLPLKKKKKHRKSADLEPEMKAATLNHNKHQESIPKDSPTEAMGVDEPKKSNKNKFVPKVVKFEDEPASSMGGTSIKEEPTKPTENLKRTPKFSILKATPSTVPEMPDSPVAKPKKVKKSENALRRIKWVKRKRRKLTKRQRKANRELALSRPRREASEHVAEAIAYLNSWYNDQENWKFKKVAQLTLIEHAFNPKLIDGETFELLLHYLEGMHDGPKQRLRGMCQELIDNGGKELESPAFPLSLPDELEGSTVVLERAKMILDNVTSTEQS